MIVIHCLHAAYNTVSIRMEVFFVELVKKKIHMDRVASKAGTQMVLEEDVNISDNRPDAA